MLLLLVVVLVAIMQLLSLTINGGLDTPVGNPVHIVLAVSSQWTMPARAWCPGEPAPPPFLRPKAVRC